MIPAWLARTRGDNTRSARLRLCPCCHSPVLAGLDSDVAALTVRVDPTPLDRLGEALALLTGRATFTLTQGDGRFELDHRDQYRIAGPLSRRQMVMPEHRCHAPPLPTIPIESVPAAPKEPVDEPPF